MVVQSCLVPVLITIIAIFCFGTVPLQELEQGLKVWWVVSVVVAMAFFGALIVTHTRITQKPIL